MGQQVEHEKNSHEETSPTSRASVISIEKSCETQKSTLRVVFQWWFGHFIYTNSNAYIYGGNLSIRGTSNTRLGDFWIILNLEKFSPFFITFTFHFPNSKFKFWEFERKKKNNHLKLKLYSQSNFATIHLCCKLYLKFGFRLLSLINVIKVLFLFPSCC